jgi:hypothetical protein
VLANRCGNLKKNVMEKQITRDEFRKRFYSNSLTKEDFKQVTICKSIPVKLNEFVREYGGTFLTINGGDYYSSLKQSGDYKGNLDKKSWDFIKSKPDEQISVDILEIKRGSELWKSYMETGFYKFNSWRQYPENILCFKDEYIGNISSEND